MLRSIFTTQNSTITPFRLKNILSGFWTLLNLRLQSFYWIYCYFIYLFFKTFKIRIFKMKIVFPYFEGFSYKVWEIHTIWQVWYCVTWDLCICSGGIWMCTPIWWSYTLMLRKVLKCENNNKYHKVFGLSISFQTTCWFCKINYRKTKTSTILFSGQGGEGNAIYNQGIFILGNRHLFIKILGINLEFWGIIYLVFSIC